MKNFTCCKCGTVFSRNKKAKYCSRACSSLARRSGGVVQCKSCGIDIYLTKNRMHRGTKENFCSKECHDKWQGREKVRLSCKVCGNEIVVSPTYANRKYCSIKCRNACQDFKRECWIKNNLELQKKKPTRLELAGRAILDEIGLGYTEQVLIGGKFVVDVVIEGQNIVIQWDGDYWHGFRAANDNIAPDRRVAKRMALDRSQDAYMAASGMTVLRFWEHEVFSSPALVRDRIIQATTGEERTTPAADDGTIPETDLF